jgi:hypothetical protein
MTALVTVASHLVREAHSLAADLSSLQDRPLELGRLDAIRQTLTSIQQRLNSIQTGTDALAADSHTRAA